MSDIHPKLRKFILSKLIEDLSDKQIHIHKSELWIIEESSNTWFMTATSFGELLYHQKFFEQYKTLFSLTSTELSKILKEWFEKNFDLSIRNVSRKQGELEYYLEKIKKDKKSVFELKNRHGFTYGFTSKYLSLKKYGGKVLVEDFLPFS